MYTCCVCLNDGKDFKMINNNFGTNNNYFNILNNIVPEIKWEENYRICTNCTLEIDKIVNFRLMCLNLEEKRRKLYESKKFMCFHCSKDFSSKKILLKHIENIHKPNEIAESKKPKLKTDTKRKFSCEQCGIEMKFTKLIIEHCIIEHGMDEKTIKPYSCDECPMRFSTSTNFIQHKKYHSGKRIHICSFCGKSYITKGDLTVHESTHYNKRRYKCNECNKAFNTNKTLRTHKLVVHTSPESWRFSCEKCLKRFPLKSGFDQHMKRHAGDKQFVCHDCEKSFVSRSELDKHIDGLHLNIKDFKCTMCKKEYKKKTSLTTHLRNRHGIGDGKIETTQMKKYFCSICSKHCISKQKLEQHLCTGDKPFECDLCGKKYADKYIFKQHLKDFHCVDDEKLNFVVGENSNAEKKDNIT